MMQGKQYYSQLMRCRLLAGAPNLEIQRVGRASRTQMEATWVFSEVPKTSIAARSAKC